MHRIDSIIDVTGSVLEIPVSELLSRKKYARHVEARAIISYIARREKFSYEEIGKILGRRHHGTIMNAYKNAVKWKEVCRQFRPKLKKVEEALSDLYVDYTKINAHIQAIAKIDLCINRLNYLMDKFKEELTQLRALKREFKQQIIRKEIV